MASSWIDDPAARDPVPPRHGEPRWMDDPDWDVAADDAPEEDGDGDDD